MAATYVPDATEHGLSPAFQALDATLQANEIVRAEAVLGLRATAYTGDDAELAKRAVALQVNLQVRIANRGDVVSEGKGRQSVKYAMHGGARVQVDPGALAIVDSLQPSLPPHSSSGSATVVF